ncbi:MAG TPA: glycosyltransferase family 4 protein [Candidatus Paceibacterota bacterium]|nr:glycosyltransferase family 4 protein [Candidatus Woesebacteria bacterium]HOY11306.1 glycosyltransferase family 4 protein [Candidatus Paceibacterota bacterium]HPV33413.1 glycosyltransferase family 4 protein [Candidatus Paceibacterota bacterium]
MKLLVITQKVDKNDPILGFFHRWLEEFTKHVEQMTVICLEKGEHRLPGVKVLSLGKEEGRSRLKYVWRFYKYLWQERKNYEAVFVHMNPVYIILAGFWWKISRKSIYLWYTHRQVDLKLRIAEKFVHKIFTAAEESLGLLTPKKIVMGHGIDLEKFNCFGQKKQSNRLVILHVGRLTKIKNCIVLLNTAELLKKKGVSFELKFVGGPVTLEDQDYLKFLQEFVKQAKLESFVQFVGFVSNDKMPHYYYQADLTVNLAPTGGIDKAVLESMACGVPVVVFNKAFVDYLDQWSSDLLLRDLSPIELSEKIISLVDKKEEIGIDIKEKIKGKIDLSVFVKKLLKEIA